MGGLRNSGTWLDNSAGLDMDVSLFGQPNIGSQQLPAGVVAAKHGVVAPRTLDSTIPADGTLEFDGTDLTIVINGARATVTVS
jgi:hypothetical protein